MAIQVNKLHTFSGHRDCVYTLQAKPGSKHFFSAAGDGMVVEWSLENPDQGELIAKLPNSIYALHYHLDTDLLIAAHNYEGIHLLDWKNKKEIGSLQLTKAAIFDLQSLGDQLLVATADGTILSVSLSRLFVKNSVKLSDKSARTMAVSPQKDELAVGYSDNAIRIFSLPELQLKYEWKAHDNSVFTLKYSPNGAILLSGSRDARIKAWEVGSSYSQVAEIVAHMYAINHLEFSPNGKHFVSCSMDKSIKVWNFEELKLLKVIDRARHAGHGTSVNKLLWTTHQDQFLSASDDRTVSCWRIIF